MSKLYGFLLLFSSALIVGCKSTAPPVVKSGTWRATLVREGRTLPFLLSIQTHSDGRTYAAYALNGTERFRLDTAYVVNDSLHIPTELYDSELVGKVEDGRLTGVWRERRLGKVVGELPFEAVHGQTHRFFEADAPAKPAALAGKWAVTFQSDDSSRTYPAVGIFEQKGELLSGTFLTETGDYRYLAGSVRGDSLYLSCFDGSHAFLFIAQRQPDGTLRGEAFYGLTGHETWTARLDSAAALPDAGSLTYLRPGYDTFDFQFPNADGHLVSRRDPVFANKVLVVQILGTWCPNCMDETRFLAPWYKKNRDRGVEVVGLAFERSAVLAESAPRLRKMAQRYDVYYPLLLAGSSNKDSASAALPSLNRVMSFPTTIILDKRGKVRHIHTGFSGPGTGVYYETFVKDFNQLIDKLLKE